MNGPRTLRRPTGQEAGTQDKQHPPQYAPAPIRRRGGGGRVSRPMWGRVDPPPPDESAGRVDPPHQTKASLSNSCSGPEDETMALQLEVVPQKAVVVRRDRSVVAACWFGPRVLRPYVYPFLAPGGLEAT